MAKSTVALAGDPGLDPSIHIVDQSCRTSVLEKLSPSSDSHEHQTHTYCMYKHKIF